MPADGDVSPCHAGGGDAAAAAAGSRVRDAAAALEGNKRSRPGGSTEEPRDAPDDPDMVFNAASGTLVHKDSLPEDRPAPKSHVLGLLAQLQRDMDKSMAKAAGAAVKAANDTLKAELFEHVGNLLTSHDKQSQKRFTSLEDDATDTKAELERHKKDLATLKADMARLSDAVGIAAKAQLTKNDVAGLTWDSPADPTVLNINTDNNTPVSKLSTKEGIAQWLLDSGVQNNEWRLEGNELDRRFKLIFAGEVGYATLKASKAFGCLRVGKEFLALAAKAPGTGAAIKLYIKQNQNQKEHKIEMDGKRFFKALQPRLGDRKVAFTRREGTIAVDWRLVVRVVPHPGDEPSTLQFNMAAKRDLKLDKDLFIDTFASIGSTSKINWSL